MGSFAALSLKLGRSLAPSQRLDFGVGLGPRETPGPGFVGYFDVGSLILVSFGPVGQCPCGLSRLASVDVPACFQLLDFRSRTYPTVAQLPKLDSLA